MKLKYWDYKATITLITSLTIIICSFFYAKFREKRLQNANVLKVGFVYEGDESTPYTSNFIASQHEIEKIYKDRIKVIVKSNVTDTNCSYALDELIQEGCGLIFTNSYNYQDDCKDYAKKYPEIQFCQATGDNSTNPVIPNYHTFMGEIYQGRYVSGVVAGLKLKELYDNGRITQEQLKIGYVAAFPYSEVISGYTAFLMGIRSIVPESKMFVKYSYSWNNYTIERSYTKELIDMGCVIISQHSDSKAPAVACEEESGEHIVYHVGYNQIMIDVAPTTSLTSTKINWSPYIVAATKAVLSKKPIEKKVTGHIFQNDAGGGFEYGWVQILELNEAIIPPQTNDIVNEKIEGFKKGSIHVFSGNYIGRNPFDKHDICNLQIEYKENQTRSAPSFNYVLDDVITIVD